jgi:benzodiazapine receptor
MNHTNTQKFQFFPLLISLVITLAIGIVASIFTRPEIPGWYSSLRKPSFNPPSWVFAPVWTTIYIMIAIAAYLVWQRRESTVNYISAKAIYFVQLALNFSWSIVFFGLHQVFMALVVIALLWLSILLNIHYFNKYSRVAAWLLLPYLLWVSFASVLNFNIYILNK